MHKYVIMGVQGSGKGTQAQLLCKKLDLVHISVGDIFRWNVQNHTKLAAKVQRIMTAGELVPDGIVNSLIEQRLAEHDWNYGFILDGFPRNEEQTRFLMENYDIDAVILVDVSDEEVVKRISGRRICASCGRDANVVFEPPQKPETCDVCGGALKQRPDDTPEAIQQRLNDYHGKTEPVLDLLMKKEGLIKADGTGTPDEVHQNILNGLGLVS